MAGHYGAEALTESPIRHTAAMTILNVNRGETTSMEIKVHRDGWVRFNGIAFASLSHLKQAFVETVDRLADERKLMTRPVP